jgi:hypothetical protein
VLSLGLELTQAHRDVEAARSKLADATAQSAKVGDLRRQSLYQRFTHNDLMLTTRRLKTSAT